MQIEVGKDRRKPVGIFGHIRPAVVQGDRESVRENLGLTGEDTFKHAVGMYALHPMLRAETQHGHVSRLRLQSADNQPRPFRQRHVVQPENVKRSAVAAAGDGRNGLGVGCRFEDNPENTRRRSRFSMRGLSSRLTGVFASELAGSLRVLLGEPDDSNAFQVEMAMLPGLLSKSLASSTASTAEVASATLIRHLLCFSAPELHLPDIVQVVKDGAAPAKNSISIRGSGRG